MADQSPPRPEGSDAPTASEPSSPMSPASFTLAAARRRRKEQEEKELAELGSGGSENVSVCIRVRPFNRRESELQSHIAMPFESVVKMPKGQDGYLQCMERDSNTGEYKLKQEFQYTKTFWSIPEDQEICDPPIEPITQLDVFHVVGEPIIKYALAGFNNCVFAYGQTGSGKTHTMTGDLKTDGEFVEQTGLIPRLCRKLFEAIEEKKMVQEDGIVKTFDVQLNAIEIYNEQVRDLFWRSCPGRSKNTPLQVRVHPVEGAFVDQLTIVRPKDWRDCINKIEKGVSERTVASTNMNDESSRSHSLFQIIVTQTETVHVRSDDPDDRYSKPVTNKKVSKINLVDLAGSERAKKSGAAGQQLKEASNINQSLFTLKKVIDSLVVNSKETNPKKHVAPPFRESTLTHLLKDSLGGNSKTTMIACVSPHFDNQEETLLTLQYANRTGAIINNTRVNEDSAAKQALALKHRILELQRQLAEGPVDEEAEELLDLIEVGRKSLKDMEDQNARADKEHAEVKVQAKQVEGALYASAVNNALEMAYSQIKKETDDQRLAELTKSLQESKADLDTLKRRMFDAKRNEESDSKRLDELRQNERAKSEVYNTTSEILAAMRGEAEKMAQRVAKEGQLSAAQRQANDDSAIAMRKKMDEDIMDSHKEHEAKLSRIILKAAEDYELQVRDFADFETSQQHKIARLEEENKTLQRKIDACTKDSVAVMSTITSAAAERSRRLASIEEDWKKRYEDMRGAYQAQITQMEEEMVRDDKVQVKRVDELTQAKRQEHLEATSELESKLIKVESEWKQKVDAAFNTHGDRIDETIRALEEESHRKAITTRRECEEKIRALYAKLDRVKYIESRHDQVLEQLRKVLQTMGAMHDRLVQEAPHDASVELRSLKAKLHRFEEKMVSSPVRNRVPMQALQGPPAPNTLLPPGADNTNVSPTEPNPLPSAARSSPGRAGGYGYPSTPVKVFNIFSKERFDNMNAKRFGMKGADPNASVAATNNNMSMSMSTTRNNMSGMGVLNSSGISLLGGPAASASLGSSLRPTLLPSNGQPEATPIRRTSVDPYASPMTMAPQPITAINTGSSSSNAGYSAAPTTPRRIQLPENVPTPKGSLHVKTQQQLQMRSAPVRRL